MAIRPCKPGSKENVFLAFTDPGGSCIESCCDMVQVTSGRPYRPRV